MVIETKLKKFYQKNNNIIKNITSTNLNSFKFKIYKGKKNQFIFSPTKQNAQTHKNNNNQTNLTRLSNRMIYVHNTELGLGLSLGFVFMLGLSLGFVFMLYFRFRFRVLF